MNTKKIFISYLRDNQSKVEKICKAFDNNNISYWIDVNDIDPGKFWKNAIKEAIKNGSLFLACFSQDLSTKETTYMNDELLTAIDVLRVKIHDSGWLIPVKLTDCKIPTINIGADRNLNDINYIDLSSDWEGGLKKLVTTIHKLHKLHKVDAREKLFNDPQKVASLKKISKFYENLPEHLKKKIATRGALEEHDLSNLTKNKDTKGVLLNREHKNHTGQQIKLLKSTLQIIKLRAGIKLEQINDFKMVFEENKYFLNKSQEKTIKSLVSHLGDVRIDDAELAGNLSPDQRKSFVDSRRKSLNQIESIEKTIEKYLRKLT